jgi:hypothetical protein
MRHIPRLRHAHSILTPLSIYVNSTGVDDADAAEVDSAATGRKLAVLSKDSVEMGHWSMELAPISAADVGQFEAGKWYEHRHAGGGGRRVSRTDPSTGQLKLLAPLAGPRKDARAGFLWRGARRR